MKSVAAYLDAVEYADRVWWVLIEIQGLTTSPFDPARIWATGVTCPKFVNILSYRGARGIGIGIANLIGKGWSGKQEPQFGMHRDPTP